MKANTHNIWEGPHKTFNLDFQLAVDITAQKGKKFFNSLPQFLDFPYFRILPPSSAPIPPPNHSLQAFKNVSFIFRVIPRPRRAPLFPMLSPYSSLLPKWLLFFKWLWISSHPEKAPLAFRRSLLQGHVFPLSSPALRDGAGCFIWHTFCP